MPFRTIGFAILLLLIQSLSGIYASRVPPEEPGRLEMSTTAFARLPISLQNRLFKRLPWYQRLKIWVSAILTLTTDAVHIYIGFTCLLIMIFFFGRDPTSLAILLPGLLASLLMETIDLYQDFNSLGFFRWMASAHDIVNTNIIPLIVVVMFKLDLEALRKRGALLGVTRKRFFGP